MKKSFRLFLFFAISIGTILNLIMPVFGETKDNVPFEVDAKSAILMESATGTVLYSKNADEPLPPASVTKVMTLLLVMEAIDSGTVGIDEEISVSEYAASMGGSQVYLEPGETMTAGELIKCVAVASANDAAVALAEAVAGSTLTVQPRACSAAASARPSAHSSIISIGVLVQPLRPS